MPHILRTFSARIRKREEHKKQTQALLEQQRRETEERRKEAEKKEREREAKIELKRLTDQQVAERRRKEATERISNNL